jgi:hypothetical protein
LKSYDSGSGSCFWKDTVPVPAPAPYLDHKKQIFLKKFGNFLPFYIVSCFYKEKVNKFQQTYCKKWMKKMWNEGNQIHNFISGSGSGTAINYGSGSDFLASYGSGSGSTSQKFTVPTVPVPQHCLHFFAKFVSVRK